MTRPNPDEYGVNPLSPLSPEEADQFAKMLLRVLPLEVIASIENALDDTHFPGNILEHRTEEGATAFEVPRHLLGESEEIEREI